MTWYSFRTECLPNISLIPRSSLDLSGVRPTSTSINHLNSTNNNSTISHEDYHSLAQN